MDLDRESLLQTFLDETEENLRVMETSLVSLEARPQDQEVLQTIFRMAHTLKGNAASLGFRGLAALAHALESQLDRLRKRPDAVTGGVIDLLLEAVDALRSMVPGAVEGNESGSEAHGRLLDRLAGREPTATAPDGAARPRSDGSSGGPARTLRVALPKLDRLMRLAGEIAIARGRSDQILAQPGTRLEEALESHREADLLYSELQELVMKIRMVPVGPTLRRHTRTVRDLAAAQGKQARLVIEGEDVEVDMAVVENLRDPLTHMIRNALDHGIESPQARLARGKDPCGQVRLSARQDAGSLVLEISDDGAGFNRQRILEEARAAEAVENPETLTDRDLFRLVFVPGFSTTQAVTDLSGRGVGMDVVRRNVEALRGSVEIKSREGAGTTITLRLPLTLAIIEGFAVAIGDETYILPVETVLECLELPGEIPSGGACLISLRGEPLPCVRLREIFRVDAPPAPREAVVVVRHESLLAGLVVDRLEGQRETVIRPLDRLIQGVRGLSGSTILGSGRVAFILDVRELLEDFVIEHASSGGPR